MFPLTVDEWSRPGPTTAQRRSDLWIGLAVTALGVITLFVSRAAGFASSAESPHVAEQIAWVLVTILPLTVRRRWPEGVALVVAVAFIGGQARGIQEQQIVNGVLFASMYTLGAWGQNRQRSRVLRLVIIGAMFGWLVLALVLNAHQMGKPAVVASLAFTTIVLNLAFFAFVYLMGNAAWQAVRRRHELEEQAVELRAAQAAAAEQAIFAERVRIARELHDVVAHHVSVMGIQASACRRAMEKDPARARTALIAIEEGARTAVDELRRMLGALRASATPDDVPVKAGIDRLPEIIDRAREAGLTVRFAVYGDPAPVPESLSLAAYRIVQEAVTNTLKHANAGTLDVRVRYLNGELELDVTDDGGGSSGEGGGMGLIGMRERVSVHDGALEHGVHPDGGYRVRARLPYPAGIAA